MVQVTPLLLRLLQPPYGWILLLILALPFWGLFVGVFTRRLRDLNGGSLARLRVVRGDRNASERELSRYAVGLTAGWLLIVAFKVHQQYFVSAPLPYTTIGAFDLSLGLFSLASWVGMLMLRTQERL